MAAVMIILLIPPRLLLLSHIFTQFPGGIVPSESMDVWYWLAIVFQYVPVDGLAAMLYGHYSRNKIVAFLVGFLPYVVDTVLIETFFAPGWYGYMSLSYYMRVIAFSLALSSSMGLMGYGGAKYGEDRGVLWLLIGLISWPLLFIIMSLLLA